MVFERLRDAISEQFAIDGDQITPATDILDDVGADSLDLIELITSMEAAFGVSVVDETVYTCRKVGDLAEYIEALTKKQA
ncbi:MAG: acyl carrier protein [Oscillospiraceae bacterium]|nr:acyl carrier protein [Oscillospiraceae bacterium]